MDTRTFRRRLQQIIGSTLTLTVMSAPYPGHSPTAPRVYLNGCCPPTDIKNSNLVRLLLDAQASNPLPSAEARQLCEELLEGKHVDKVVLSDQGRVPSTADTYNMTIQTSEGTNQQGDRYLSCTYEYSIACVGGRLPNGLDVQASMESQHEVGAYFAQLAYLEEAAVLAFDFVIEELKQLGAPQVLIEQSLAAKQDEIEHTILATQLAKRYGATPPPVEASTFTMRPLVEIAIDNQREGCVRETYGSLMGMWQSMTSIDPVVRAVMERIALDESRHAALSWSISEWLTPQLSETEQNTCRQVLHETLTQLRTELATSPSKDMITYAGFPTHEQAQQLLDGLQRQYWQFVSTTSP